MKIFTTKMLALVTSALLLGACSQMATYENEDLLSNQEVAAKNGFNLTPFGTGNENARTYAATDCDNFCIDPGNPEYSMQTAAINNNSGPQTRVFTYTVHNTLTGFELAWNYASTNSAGRKLKITVSGAGFASPKTYTSNQLNGGPGNGTNTFTFDASWAACGVVTVVAEILDGDNVLVSGPNTTTYKLIGACVVGCDEESFSYVATNDNLSVTFKYDAATALTGAVVEFTFPQIIGFPLNGDGKFLAPDGKLYTVNNPINQTVFTWTGDIGCTNATATTFQFNFSPDCGAGNANDGQARIWADTKINGVSVKNSATLNIDYVKCSIPA